MTKIMCTYIINLKNYIFYDVPVFVNKSTYYTPCTISLSHLEITQKFIIHIIKLEKIF